MQSQPDGKHRFILNYQDHLTKMVCLRALQTKTAEEVAFHLVDIFCNKGAPHILQSDNGREFSNKHVKEVLSARWFMANHDIPNRRARWNVPTGILKPFSHVG
ncbi:KRAB-A domain-containing protein 2-like [Portunus trituberculatus]|nr:KRAB-A domain-containing protein 2-like [Portunus trituberculatus]